MRYEVIQTGAGRLMIVFAGWSTRPSLYRGYIRSGFDLMVVYDYSDVEFPDVDCLKEYREICVVAWSFGVAVAHRWLLSCPDLPITRTLAVNGTPWPVDDRRGIPCRVFGLTLRTLSERSVGEFRKRMFAVSDPMPDFEPVGVEHLRGELESISRMGVNDPAREDDICVWDKVIVSKSDRIIPFAGQMEAWHGHPDMTVTGGAHFPDWTQVMAMASVDKDSVERNFSHGAPTYDGAATVQRAMAARLSEIWREVSSGRRITDVVEIGPGTGLFTRAYLGWLRGANLEFWDLAAIGDDLPGKKRICDAELAVRGMADNSADAIVASASVQWFNSLGRYLAECGRVLRPGGQVVISTFGRSTFHELSGIITPAATYLDADGLARLTPDAMELTMSDDGRTATVDFESASDLLRHMSRTGVNTSSASSGNIAAARSIVRQRITRLTYHPVYAIFTKTHPCS